MQNLLNLSKVADLQTNTTHGITVESRPFLIFHTSLSNIIVIYWFNIEKIDELQMKTADWILFKLSYFESHLSFLLSAYNFLLILFVMQKLKSTRPHIDLVGWIESNS